MWDLIVSVHDHCLSVYFTLKKTTSWTTAGQVQGVASGYNPLIKAFIETVNKFEGKRRYQPWLDLQVEMQSVAYKLGYILF